MSEPSTATAPSSREKINTILSKAEGAAAGGTAGAFLALLTILFDTGVSSLVPVIGTVAGAGIGLAVTSRALGRLKNQALPASSVQDASGSRV